MSKIYTTKQVGEMFGLHRVSITNACRLGTIKAKKFGRDYAITEEALGRWVCNHYRPSRLKWNSDARQALELLDHIRKLAAPLDKQAAPTQSPE
jgi:hypothetical protein